MCGSCFVIWWTKELVMPKSSIDDERIPEYPLYIFQDINGFAKYEINPAYSHTRRSILVSCPTCRERFTYWFTYPFHYSHNTTDEKHERNPYWHTLNRASEVVLLLL